MAITTDVQKQQILLNLSHARNEMASLNVALTQLEHAVRANDPSNVSDQVRALQDRANNVQAFAQAVNVQIAGSGSAAGNVSAHVFRITNIRGDMTHAGGLPVFAATTP